MELKKYWEIFWRKKILFAIIVLIITLVPIILAYILPPIYTARARVMISLKDIQSEYLDSLPQNLGTFSYVEEKNVADTYSELLKNSVSMQRLIKKLNLQDSDGNYLQPNDFILSILKYPKFFIKTKRAFNVKQIQSSEIFAMIGYSSDPEEAVKIANGAVEVFLDLYSQLYHQKTTIALNAMKKQLQQIEKELYETEQKKIDLTIKKGLIDSDSQTEALIEQIVSLDSIYYQTKRSQMENLATLQKIKEEMTKVPELYTTSIVSITNDVIDNHKEQLLQFETSLARLIVELTLEHPDVKILQKQIDAVKKSLKEEALSSIMDSKNPYYTNLISQYSETEIENTGLKVREDVLSSQIKAKKAELEQIPAKETAIKDVDRDVEVLATHYNSLKKAINYANAALEMNIANISVVNYADIAHIDLKSPFFPQKKKIAIFAAALGISLAFFAILLLEYLDTSLKTADNTEKILGVPVLAEVTITPKAKKWITDKENNLTGSKDDPYISAFLNLKSSIRLAASGNQPKIITITGIDKGEDKSIISFLTAKAFAVTGTKVLLIDSDLRRPSLKNFFTLDESKGLLNLLSKDSIRDIDLQDNIYKTSNGNLDLIHTAQHPYPLQFIDSYNMENLMSLLKTAEQYNLIIINASPLKDGKESLLLSHLSDKAIIVIQGCKTDTNDALKAVENLNTPLGKVLGIVFNIKKKLI